MLAHGDRGVEPAARACGGAPREGQNNLLHITYSILTTLPMSLAWSHRAVLASWCRVWMLIYHFYNTLFYNITECHSSCLHATRKTERLKLKVLFNLVVWEQILLIFCQTACKGRVCFPLGCFRVVCDLFPLEWRYEMTMTRFSVIPIPLNLKLFTVSTPAPLMYRQTSVYSPLINDHLPVFCWHSALQDCRFPPDINTLFVWNPGWFALLSIKLSSRWWTAWTGGGLSTQSRVGSSVEH